MVEISKQDAAALDALANARHWLEEAGRLQPSFFTELNAAKARIAAIENQIQRAHQLRNQGGGG